MSFGGPGGSGSIAGSTDVVLNSPTNNQVLGYNTSLAKWQNQAPVTVTGATADGRVLCTGFTRAAVIAALNSAEALGRGTVVYFPSGVYDVGNGLSLSGYSCQIQGAGATGSGTGSAGADGTTFYASTQTGPVLDFTGYVIPFPSHVFSGKIRHGNFQILGSGAADATKVRSGIRLAIMSSTTFHDIAIRETGGPCWENVASPGNAAYLCDYERIILNTPVSAKANDVPWMIMNESNGNNFRGIGFRSMLASGDVGVSGALVMVGNASFAGYANRFDGCWMENLHAPTNGCLISMAGYLNTHDGWNFHDCFKESGATGTAFVRFLSPTANDYGGNIWRGAVPGYGGGLEIDYGISVSQSYNRIEGPRGYTATASNVLLNAGVGRTFIELGGSTAAPGGNSVTDNSGTNTNVVIDGTRDGLQFSGNIGFHGATPVAKAGNPGSASGSDAAVINNIVTALRNHGIVT